MPLLAYLDEWVARPGDPVSIMASTDTVGRTARATVRLVRILGGGPRPEGEPDALRTVEVVPPQSVAVGHQRIRPGSFVRLDRAALPAPDALATATVSGWLWPTLPAAGHPQTLWAATDGDVTIAMDLDPAGHLGLRWSGSGEDPGEVRLDAPVTDRTWLHVTLEVDTESVTLTAGDVRLRGPAPRTPTASPAQWLAAGPDGADCLNGKLAGWLVTDRRTGTSVSWDFAGDHAGDAVHDQHGRRVGTVVGVPLRAVVGPHWDGSVLNPALAPDAYDAIHFHDDDVDDLEWSETATMIIPADVGSGLYAVEITAEAESTLVPIFVRPLAGTTAEVAVVLPTFSYLAYSNYVVGFDDIAFYTGLDHDRDPLDAHLRAHPELGLSIYNRHRDGTGIHRASRRRPILNHDPRHRFWQHGGGWTVGGDLYLLDWLDQEGIAVDVLTDDDLHVEGAALLGSYGVVITGAHPEYASAAMLDAYRSYADRGGHLMYLGGNGFYWVTTPLGTDGTVSRVEVRRGYAGTRAWDSHPGELHHQATGEQGGLWRHRGRPPQSVVGVGFGAQGGGDAAGFGLTGAGRTDPRVAFVRDGVRAEVFGTYGFNLGGAAGCEVDRADRALGTPADAVVIATSSGLHSDFYQRATEENPITWPGHGGTEDADVRADVVWFPTAGGGQVFSVGSIDWTSALLADPGDGRPNDVATITRNVLRHFLGPSEPLSAS